MYLTEDTDGFTIHRSLLDDPYRFETSLVKGSIFYLPKDDGLGGDTFMIAADRGLTLSFLEDMTAHGSRGRELLTPYLQELRRFLPEARKGPDFLIESIIEIDKKLDPRHLIALSFARLEADGTAIS